MSITDLFIRRPVMTTLVMLGIVLFGVMGYRSLAVSDLPNVDFPTIQVQVALPGASAETMASSVAAPLERQFTTIAGIDSMSSTSYVGSTNITIQFTLSRSLDGAAQDVQTAIASVLRKLPPNLPAPPTLRKVNPADQPILAMALYSSTLPLATMDAFGEEILAQRISQIDGVAQVNIFGQAKYAVRAQLDPALLASRNVSIDEVNDALGHHNVNLPTGTLWGNHWAYTVEANGQLNTAEEYRPLIVAYRNGSPVRLGELGRVIDSIQNDKNGSWYGSIPSVQFSIQRQPGANTVEVVDNIKALLPKLRSQMPPAMKLDIFYDRSFSIRESVNDVKATLLITVVLVVGVIFVFLRNVSATVIPSLALPLSIIGTFAAMYLLGYTLDNLSLMALTLSVGFVVDDAIVMLENIVRHMEMGKARMVAALEGAREIGFTIVSMTISLAAVFIPVLFMSGIMGRLFHEFAVTIMVAIVISGFVSLSLTPMLCSRFLKPPAEHLNAFQRISEGAFEGLRKLYAWTLRGVLRHRFLTVATAAGTLVASVYLFGLVPKGFIPSQDVGQINGATEGPQGISYDDMVRATQIAERIAEADPAIDGVRSQVAGGNNNPSANNGQLNLHLRPRSERKETPEQVIARLRPKMDQIPGIKVYLSNRPLITIGGIQSKSNFQYTLQAPDLGELYRVAPDFEQKLRALPELTDVNSDLQNQNPTVTLDIDRDKASALGVTADQIESALYSAYGTRQASTIFTPVDDFQVILEVLPKYQLDPTALGMLYIRSNTGKLVPMNAAAKLRLGTGPLSVSHLGQAPAVTVSFNTKEGVALGDAVEHIEQVARETLPDNVTTSFQGTAAAFQDSLKGMGVLLLMAVLVIYLVLGILYESFIHPLTILSGLPSAGLGALATLLIFHDELNLYSFVGIIMLIGIVKKNAIMMIDFALETQREHGTPPSEAIHEACLVRFRPIMMTTMAALMGTLPIALGLGAGGEARRPLGLAVVGGLVVSQLLTLYITPVFYTYMERFQGFTGRFRRSKKRVPTPAKEREVAFTD
ncbi:MAG TPA: efflux RND transporter permease subunit [Bryobacteraceae bacterium]|jgi:HAE1 family hydrophobic/amphiphilic exporter-1|nr:efflux RND transporter permease subunit [Bryobacteraceae bacterium]